jgi:hypothetical protein
MRRLDSQSAVASISGSGDSGDLVLLFSSCPYTFLMICRTYCGWSNWTLDRGLVRQESGEEGERNTSISLHFSRDHHVISTVLQGTTAAVIGSLTDADIGLTSNQCGDRLRDNLLPRSGNHFTRCLPFKLASRLRPGDCSFRNWIVAF